jgi:hypothetical protein
MFQNLQANNNFFYLDLNNSYIPRLVLKDKIDQTETSSYLKFRQRIRDKVSAVYIDFTPLWLAFTNGEDLTFSIPGAVFFDMKKTSNLKLIISLDNESASLDMYSWLIDSIIKAQIPTSQIYIIENNSVSIDYVKRNFETFDINFIVGGFEKQVLHLYGAKNQTKRFDHRKFLYLNRRHDLIRLYLFWRMQDFLDDSYYSFVCNDPYSKSFEKTLPKEDLLIVYPDRSFILSDTEKNNIRSFIDSVYDSLPKILEFSPNFYDYAHTVTNLQNYYYSTDFSLITETNADYESNRAFLTEKTFRPILFSHPFVLAGGFQSLKALRDLGYKTFSPYIDESYDEIADNKTRADAVIHSIQSILKLNESGYKQWLSCVKNIAAYNRQVFIERASSLENSIEKKLLK